MLLVPTSEFDSSGDSAVARTQCLVRQWIHVHASVRGAFGRVFFSSVKWTRILRFSEVCSADASALSLGMRCSHLEICEVHVAGSGDDGGVSAQALAHVKQSQ